MSAAVGVTIATALIALCMVGIIAYAIYLAWRGHEIERDEQRLEQRTRQVIPFRTPYSRPPDDEPPRAA